MWVTFETITTPKPSNKIYVGNVVRTTATEQFGYNCFTDDGLTYQDDKYTKCTSLVSCYQTDALKILIKGSGDTARAVEFTMSGKFHLLEIAEREHC